MPKRIEIVPHLSVTELQAKYRTAKNPVTLKAMEYRLRIPRPENKQADPIEQEAWKKNCH